LSLYRDLNNNGVADAGELVATTATDSTGAYSFPNLPNGQYLVIETDPAGATSVNDTQGLPTDNKIAVTLSGASSSGNNFLDDGTPTYRVSGTVYNDADLTGTFSGGDTTISGVTVQLWADLNNNGVFDAGDQLMATTNTVSGAYSFPNVPMANIW